MPGLKALSDLTEGPQQSRAVAAHAAAVGVSGALSFGIAGAVNAWLGWQWALVPGALGAALAFVLVLVGLPARPLRAAPGPRGALLDFRPVLRNRSALAYSNAYCVHTWEMSALRGWVVTFLTFVAAQRSGTWPPLAPATVASVMGLIGVWASVWGNELAIRFGRRRFILGTMLTSAALAAVIGFSAALPYAVAAAFILLYAVLIWSDSSSLTAGSAGSAEPGRRGATLAVHSTLGYAGGFLGPLALGCPYSDTACRGRDDSARRVDAYRVPRPRREPDGNAAPLPRAPAARGRRRCRRAGEGRWPRSCAWSARGTPPGLRARARWHRPDARLTGRPVQGR